MNENNQMFIQTLKAEMPFSDAIGVINGIGGGNSMETYNNTIFTEENTPRFTTTSAFSRKSNEDPNMRKLTRIILDVINAYGFLPQSYISLEYKTKWYAVNRNKERVEQDPVTERAYKMFRTIRGITDFTPYRIRGRLAVKDKETGRVFK